MSHFGNNPTPPHIKKLFQKLKVAARSSPWERRALVCLMLWTGLRIDEAVLQKWSDGWGLENRWISLRAETVKGKRKRRYIYQPRLLEKMLWRIRPGSGLGYIFPGKKKWGRKSRKVASITTRTGERWIRQVGRKAGAPDLEAHDLRRLFATMYYINSHISSGDLYGLQLMMGHDRPGTTQLYIRTKRASIARTIEKITEL